LPSCACRASPNSRPPGTGSAAEKIEHLLGISLDRARAISFHARRPSSIRTGWVWRNVFMIGVKTLLDSKLGREAPRARNSDAVLEELTRQLGEKEAAASGA
jgi:hypothetical protein